MPARLCLVCLLLMLAWVPAFADGQALPPQEPVLPDGVGVNIHFTHPQPDELEQLAAAGFKWIRIDFGWGGTEREKGRYDFSEFDHLLGALEKQHLRALFILDYSNRHYDNDLSPHSDEGRATMARWAAAAVHHFKGRGVLWEMYNEPNGTFWRPRTNVDDYAKLALAVGKAIRDAEPGETYIGPATSQMDFPFLEACFKAGCLEYWSAVSVHPYRQEDPETVAADYQKLRLLIARYAPKDKQIPIISGEWGFSAAWKDFDEARQAKYLSRELLTNLANGIPLSIWYDWHDDGNDPKEPEHHFGTVHAEAHAAPAPLYAPKPAYRAAKAMGDTLRGLHFSKRLAVGGAEDYVLLFDDDADRSRIVGWTIAGKPHAVMIPSGAGKFDLIDNEGGSLGEAAADSSGLLQVELTDVPKYIVPKEPSDLLRIAAAWTRVPLEIVIQGPTTAKVEAALRNPLGRPIIVIQGERKTTLKPGETTPIMAEAHLGRDVALLSVEVVLEVEGLGRLAQRTDVIASNPLHAHLIVTHSKTVGARIENPAGDALTGKADLPLEDINSYTPFADFEMKAGEYTKAIAFDLHRLPSARQEASFFLTDAAGHIILSLPAARYQPLIDLSSKDHGGLDVAPDGDAKVRSEQALIAALPPDGAVGDGVAAVKLSYKLDAGWKFLRVGSRKGIALDGKPDSLGIWVYGDGTGNILRMRFNDAGGQCFQVDGGRITWTGWHYVSFPLTAKSAGHWGGADDGVIHYPIRVDTLLLLDSTSRQATKGEIYLSAPVVVYGK
jgi:hypothetical protein